MVDVQEEFDRAREHAFDEDDVERDRLLLGIDVASRQREWITTASPETIRNFAVSYGDDNPLYCDPSYGATSRWGTQIAPPIMAAILNAPLEGDPLDRDLKQRTKGTYKGLHAFVSGGRWEWFRPIRPGDTIFSFEGVESIDVKETEFAGRSVFRTRRHVKINQNAEVVGVYRVLIIYSERRKSKEKAVNAAIEPASYTDDDLARIEAIYDAETVRGAQTRWWDDVSVGDPLPAMVKGPLTVTDMVVFHAGGYGFVPYGLNTSRLAHQNRRRIPTFFIKNDQGVPDVAQRVHWDPMWAQAIGNPMAYDYGVMRMCWLHHYVTDWMGDDGWVLEQSTEVRKFNFVGDTQFIAGTVADKRNGPAGPQVTLEITGTNQRDEVTTLGTATVLLPSQGAGPVLLPVPPADLQRSAIEIIARRGQIQLERDGSHG